MAPHPITDAEKSAQIPPVRVDAVERQFTGWTMRGALLRAAMVGTLASLVVVVVLVVSPQRERQVAIDAPLLQMAPSSPPHDNLEGAEEPAPEQTPPSESSNSGKASESAPTPGEMIAPPAIGLNDALAGIVVIRSNDALGTASLGAGFVVSADGLVATNYHVISEATEARATFRNGTSYEIEGYAAIRPEEDLAIVRLRKPPQLKALPIHATELPSLSSVIAIGHPEGLDFSPSDGRVSRVIETRNLPQRSRQFLREIVSASTNHLWIQHTAGISPGSSGGPLITPQGKVVGINTWVDGQTQFGYALHIKHVERLLNEPLESVAPLDRYAKPAARVAAMLQKLSGERIRHLFSQAEAMNWLPETREQYELLQQLAWSMTAANLPSTFTYSRTLDDRLKELVTETARVRRKLTQRKWNGLGQVTLINELASEVLMEPMAGVVVFAQVLRVVSGAGGSRGMLMEVSGLDQTVFIPLDGQLDHPPVGANCLLFGVNYDGQVVRYGDNPLQLIVAPVIISEMILELAP